MKIVVLYEKGTSYPKPFQIKRLALRSYPRGLIRDGWIVAGARANLCKTEKMH